MPRTRRPLVRQRPLSERIAAYLNPWDLLLWLSEEIETRDIGSKSLGTKLGLGLNFVFLLASANSRLLDSRSDVFGDDGGAGWLSYLATALVWILALASGVNLAWTLLRTRAYRLFEANVEQRLETPSAHRVRVQSSPAAASSPLRILAEVLTETAESRAHPDKTRDVWELRLWDPLPASLQVVCLFSPLHVLVYMLSFPLPPLDPRPSVTVFKCLLQQIAWSSLLLVLQARFSQQNKDAATIQKWVMKEYDTKYVHPRLHPVVRNASTQCGTDAEGNDMDFAEFGTPTTVISRGFQTHPNRNYAKHFDPDNVGSKPSSMSSTPVVFTPPSHTRESEAALSSRRARLSSRQSLPGTAFNSAPELPRPPRVSSGVNFGGSLGAYSHANSPLRKATSLDQMREESEEQQSSPIRNNRDMAAIEQRDLADRMIRRHSPVKTSLTPFKTPRSSMSSSKPRESDHRPSPNPFSRVGR